jgi:hypothetical protein
MKHLIQLGTQFIWFRDAGEDMRGKTLFLLYSPLSSANFLLFSKIYFDLWNFLENLDRAEQRAEQLATKLEQSKKAREKAEREAATVEDLLQRLHRAENALSDKVSQQIARENAITARLETQNRCFVSKYLPSPAFVSILPLLLFILMNFYFAPVGRWVKILPCMKLRMILFSTPFQSSSSTGIWRAPIFLMRGLRSRASSPISSQCRHSRKISPSLPGASYLRKILRWLIDMRI